MNAPAAKASHIWQRDELDWYVEPLRVTEQLLTVERFVGGILDPCCGQGNIVRALQDGGYRAVAGSDIRRRVGPDATWFNGEHDFLQAQGLWADNIVMNPPFFRGKGAEAFIRKALQVASAKVCAFVDCRFLLGAGRADGLYAEHPPHRIWIVTPRPSCPPGEYLAAGNKAGGGTADYCWLVWDRTMPPATSAATGWLRRSS